MQHGFDATFVQQEIVNRVFSAKGELAGLCREKDWSETPLGPIESWPASLHTIAALVVASPLPMIVLWGPELVQIYNDGYRDVMGRKHPFGLGQPTRQCWQEVWEFNAPLYEGVINRRETFTFKDQRLVIERHGQPEEAFFTFGYSPVFDDQGAVRGVLVTVSETTMEVEQGKPMAKASESEERLRVALEAADLGTWDLDLTTDTAAVRSLRHDQIFGYEQHQAEWGQEIAMRHVLPEDRPIFQEAFAQAMKTGILSFQVRVRWPDGSIHWIAPLGRTYYDNEQCPVRMAGVVADVTDRNQAEALRQSEERFRLMANAVPQIVWITDREGRLEFFNQQWSNYTGLTYNPEAAAEVAAAIVHPDDAAITMERFEQAQSSGTVFLVEHRIRSAAGEYRWFLVRAEPYRDPGSGQISRWFGASVDIHDRKLAEEALRLQTARQALAERQRIAESADQVRKLQAAEERALVAARESESERQLLNALLDAAPVGIIMADANGKLIHMNRANAQIWGSDAPFAESVDEYREWKGWWADKSEQHGRPLQPHDWPLARTLTGKRVAGDIIEIEPFGHPGVRRTVLVSGTPVSDTERNVVGGVVAVTDITDRLLIEASFRQSQAHLASFFQQTAAGIAETDLQGRFTLVNDRYCQIVGRNRDQLIGQNLLTLIHPDDREHNLQRLDQLVKTGKSFEIENRYLLPDGSAVWVGKTVSPIQANGSLPSSSIMAVVLDITARKQAEEKVREADRRKDEFLAMLAHELRNPLAPIGAAAELLQLAKLDEARVRQTSQVICRQVNHMTSLVDDLLDVSRVTRGLVELDNTPLDISQLVTDAIEQATPLIRSRHHHLAMHLPPDTTMVMGDSKRLVQTFVNILNNAAKYTHEGGNLVLKVDVHNDRVHIEVSDNGIGMAPDLVSHAFDLFAQAERTSDRSSGGLGLGLALVKSLVELHRGTVKCESAGLGKGSRFTVCLPRLFVDEPQGQAQYTDNDIPAKSHSLRIMVVDDNADAASMLAMLLKMSGHQVSVEHASRKALERAREEAPQVCLLDIGLPEMDGNELAQRLRAQPETAHSLLIAVTGYGREQDRKQTLAAGFDHHLVKPVDTKKLAAIIAKASKV